MLEMSITVVVTPMAFQYLYQLPFDTAVPMHADNLVLIRAIVLHCPTLVA